MKQHVVVIFCYYFISTVGAAQQMGHDYLVSMDDERVFTPCAEYPDNFIMSFFDLSRQTYEILENETLHVKGPLTVLDYPQDIKLPFRFQLLKKDRGQWVSTIYNGNRPDFCESLMSSVEAWHSIFENIPKELRQCPFKEKTTAELDTLIQVRLSNIQDKYMAGEYKVNAMSTLNKNAKGFFCFNIMVHLYKV